MFSHYYSDPHYDHENMIKHADRPFHGVKHMNREFIELYNSCVSSDDYVLWCGDCGWYNHASGFGSLLSIMESLNGKKALVIGNHDLSPTKMARLPFEFVTDRLYTTINGHDVIVSHYPPAKSKYEGKHYDHKFVARMPMCEKSTVVIHGHTHEKIRAPFGQSRVHVGVDAWDYKPAPAADVHALFDWALGKVHE